MSEGNKAIVRRLTEAGGGGGADYGAVLRELMASDGIAHLPFGDHYGPEGVALDALEWGKAFPDMTVVVLDLFADGDRVARRFQLSGTHLGPFLGLAPTGRRMAITGMAIDRLAGGQIHESWVELDLHGLQRQLTADHLPPARDDRKGSAR
jgi:predicted ester cyclase